MRRFLNSLKSDESLMLLYQQGDSAAFEILYLRHKDALFRFIYQHCQNQASAEDIAHDTWTTLIRRAETYEVRATFKTYLFKIAYSRVVDHWRRQKPEEALDDEPAPTELAATALETEMIKAEERENILSAITSLNADQRDAFLLREADLSYEQIAQITGTGVETVKSRLRYAKQAIEQHMTTRYEDAATSVQEPQ